MNKEKYVVFFHNFFSFSTCTTDTIETPPCGQSQSVKIVAICEKSDLINKLKKSLFRLE